MVRIVVGVERHHVTDGAIRLAARLEEQVGARVEAVRVVEPAPAGTGSGLSALPGSLGEEDDRFSAARVQLEETMRRFGPGPAAWPRRAVQGAVPRTMVSVAEERDASLIVMGAGRHSALDRVLGTETAGRVVHLSRVPVVAVPEGGGDVPRVVVAALDFSGYANRALEQALAVCAPGATLHLVHVLSPPPTDDEEFEDPDLREDAETRVRFQLAELADSIPGLGAFEVELHAVAGGVTEEILKLADRVGAELIVAGSHGRGFIGRLLLGSTTRGLLHRARTAVFVAPPPDPVEEAGERAVERRVAVGR